MLSTSGSFLRGSERISRDSGLESFRTSRNGEREFRRQIIAATLLAAAVRGESNAVRSGDQMRSPRGESYALAEAKLTKVEHPDLAFDDVKVENTLVTAAASVAGRVEILAGIRPVSPTYC